MRLGASTSVHRRLPKLLPEKPPTDPNPATVINAWNRLPEAVRARIVAMVNTTSGEGS
jgi:hypothetical protein